METLSEGQAEAAANATSPSLAFTSPATSSTPASAMKSVTVDKAIVQAETDNDGTASVRAATKLTGVETAVEPSNHPEFSAGDDAAAEAGRGDVVLAPMMTCPSARMFYRSLHENYLLHLDDDPYTLESFFSQHIRMGGAYWMFTSLWLLDSSAVSLPLRRTCPTTASHSLQLPTSSAVSSQVNISQYAAAAAKTHVVPSASSSQFSAARSEHSSAVYESTGNLSYSVALSSRSASAAIHSRSPAADAGADETNTAPNPAANCSTAPAASASLTSSTLSFYHDPAAVSASVSPAPAQGGQDGDPSLASPGARLDLHEPFAAVSCLSESSASPALANGSPPHSATPASSIPAVDGPVPVACVWGGSLRSTREDQLTAWIFSCQHSSGGFGQGPGQDPHITSTHYAVLLLLCMGRLHLLNRQKVAAWVLQLRAVGGGFKGDVWGECDTRFAYCGAACLTLLNHFDRDTALETASYVQKCRNIDGGYGWVPGGESHAASAFCCIATLALCERLALVEREILASWLLERQLATGGFNGRPEKAPDICYSFWILAALAIIGCMHWVNIEALTAFVLEAQDELHGGIADRPGDVPDVFHTYFGIAALSLMQTIPGIKKVHPVFSIPCEVARRENLGCCVLWE